MQPYEHCAAGKAKQKNILKMSEHEKATTEACRTFLGISTIKKTKEEGPNITKPNWRMIV
jgi:hypothetical protein